MPLFRKDKKEEKKNLSAKMGCVYKDYSQFPDQKTKSKFPNSKIFSISKQSLLSGKEKLM